MFKKKNIYYLITSFIFLIILINFNLTNSQVVDLRQDVKERIKKWKEDLKRYPVPKGAIKLRKLFSFPSKELEEKGIYLYNALRICVDNDKYIYVSSQLEHRILKFDINGKFLKQIGKKGKGPGEFLGPKDIDVDGKGHLYIRDVINRRIQIFNSKGEYLSSFRYFKTIYSMVVDKDGFIYTNPQSFDPQYPLIEVFNMKGELVKSFGKRINFGNYSFAHSKAILTISSNGELIVAWESFDYLRKYSKDGKLLLETRLKHKYVNEKSKINMETKFKSMMMGLYRTITDIYSTKNAIYVLITYPRIEILKFDNNFHLENVFWADVVPRYLGFDFFVLEKDNGQLLFYILQCLPENKIEVFTNSTKKKM
jgi:hypothetical protein